MDLCTIQGQIIKIVWSFPLNIMVQDPQSGNLNQIHDGLNLDHWQK